MARKKNRQRDQTLIVTAVLTVMAIGVGAAAWSVLDGDPAGESGRSPSIAEHFAETTPVEPPPPATKAPPTTDRVAPAIDDDGRTLWASPTAGAPIGLEHLPLDCQLVLHLRPAEIAADEQASRALRSLGPGGQRLLAASEAVIGHRLDKLRRLTIGIRPGPQGELEATFVVEPARQSNPSSKSDNPHGPPGGGREAEHAGVTYRVKQGWCYLRIEDDDRGRYVAGGEASMREVIDAGGAPPPLRREMEQLLDASDADRHASLLVAPSFLFTGGKSLLTGSTQALRDPLFDQTPDDLRAALLSMHWSDSGFYWELRGAAAADTTPIRLARRLEEQIDQWPNEVQLAVLDANPAPHGRRLVAQLPLMLGVLAKYVRVGVEGRHAVANGYLPPPAGHNLLLAAELLLAQQSAGGGPRALGSKLAANPPKKPLSVAEKLAQPVSVVFARDTLEQAVRYLSDEMDVPIVILGDDLRLEGITKNQSFGLDSPDQPAGRVLLEILTRANPNKTAAGPSDPKQQLVYVVREEPGGGATIYITTRAAVKKREERLPSVFGS